MSTPDKPDHARGWRYVEKLLDEEEDERIQGLSDEQVRAELRQRPAQPEGEWDADEMLAAAAAIAAKGAKETPTVVGETAKVAVDAPPKPAVASPARQPRGVVPLRRPWRTFGLLAAACFALFVIVKARQGPDIVSHPPPPDREIADADRDAAEASCAMKDWAACKKSLDEAAKLDPEGESEPRVRKAREEIAAGMAGHPGTGELEKPGP